MWDMLCITKDDEKALALGSHVKSQSQTALALQALLKLQE